MLICLIFTEEKAFLALIEKPVAKFTGAPAGNDCYGGHPRMVRPGC